MSDRRRYTPSPIPNQVDVAWLKQEFQRLSQSLALVEDALLSLDGQLGGYGEDIEAIEGWPAAGATAEDFAGWDDLRFPAQAINPAGAVDAPSIDTTLTRMLMASSLSSSIGTSTKAGRSSPTRPRVRRATWKLATRMSPITIRR